MHNERIIPEGGANPYAEHPGFDAQDCELSITVTGRNNDSVSGGFACSASGGHCLPDEAICNARLKSTRQQEHFLSLIRESEDA